MALEGDRPLVRRFKRTRLGCNDGVDLKISTYRRCQGDRAGQRLEITAIGNLPSPGKHLRERLRHLALDSPGIEVNEGCNAPQIAKCLTALMLAIIRGNLRYSITGNYDW